MMGQQQLLIAKAKLGKVGDDANGIAIEGSDQIAVHRKDVNETILGGVFAGVEQSNEWIPSDVKEPSLEPVMLREHPLCERGLRSVELSRPTRHEIYQHSPFGFAKILLLPSHDGGT